VCVCTQKTAFGEQNFIKRFAFKTNWNGCTRRKSSNKRPDKIQYQTSTCLVLSEIVNRILYQRTGQSIKCRRYVPHVCVCLLGYYHNDPGGVAERRSDVSVQEGLLPLERLLHGTLGWTRSLTSLCLSVCLSVSLYLVS